MVKREANPGILSELQTLQNNIFGLFLKGLNGGPPRAPPANQQGQPNKHPNQPIQVQLVVN